MKSLLYVVLLGLGILAMFTPAFQLSRSASISGKELSEKYPEHRWARQGFLILYLLWLVLAFLVLFRVVSWNRAVPFLGAYFSSIGFFFGILPLITGVGVLPTKAPWLFFIVGSEARRVGRFQVAFSTIVFIIAFVVDVFSV